MNSRNSEFLNLSIQLALEAGSLLKEGFGSSFKISSKEGKQNLVTEYDKKSETLILEKIAKKFPQHGFLAEESGASVKKQEITWIIDPLDGTVNFARNIPLFCVSIAVAVGDEVVCGVVFQPMTQELFFAEKAKGAFLNGSCLRVSSVSCLEDSFLATGFPYNVDENPLHCIEVFSSIAKLGAPIRRLGSAALDLSYVAKGRFDAFWEVVLQPWDIAAAKLFVEEAGGSVSRYNGTSFSIFEKGPVVASNSLIHSALIQRLQWQP